MINILKKVIQYFDHHIGTLIVILIIIIAMVEAIRKLIG